MTYIWKKKGNDEGGNKLRAQAASRLCRAGMCGIVRNNMSLFPRYQVSFPSFQGGCK